MENLSVLVFTEEIENIDNIRILRGYVKFPITIYLILTIVNSCMNKCKIYGQSLMAVNKTIQSSKTC